MNMSKAHTPPKPAFSAWINWIKGLRTGHGKNAPVSHVRMDEFSDHMMRDIGALDGRSSTGYRRRHSVDGRLDDNFNGPL